MLCTCHNAPGLSQALSEAPRRHHSASLAGSIVDRLRAVRDAWREALAAHRDYEHLKSLGVPHDAALRSSLGICGAPPTLKHGTARRLYVAGRA